MKENMPEFLKLTPPDRARSLLLENVSIPNLESFEINVIDALECVIARDIKAIHPLPTFNRSSVDGYAVIAKDTFGASESMPGYLKLMGEVQMGKAPTFELIPGQGAIIHTGGMLPQNATAVIMLEHVQEINGKEIEIQRSVAENENVIWVGEDVAHNQIVIHKGTKLRPADIGGLMALGIQKIHIYKKPKIGIISSGDEIVAPDQKIEPGQVRDINSYSLGSLIVQNGGEPIFYGIVPDQFDQLEKTAEKALNECDALIITAGSSASVRDMTAEVINSLGKPGVIVHGISIRPGKPTIIGIINGKAVIGLPGNPVSAMVNGYLMVVPLLEKISGNLFPKPRSFVKAKLTVNISSQAGREDWQTVKLVKQGNELLAVPIFGKSNLIFSLASADGLIKIESNANGVNSGDFVDVFVIR